jgi:ATP-dependent exoDNAse (exonuclease V) beta subunit
VFWLDRAGTCPSKWARQAWQAEQENNLCYVAATRSMSELIEILVDEKAKKTTAE